MTKQEAMQEAERTGGTYHQTQVPGVGLTWVVEPPEGKPVTIVTKPATAPKRRK